MSELYALKNTPASAFGSVRYKLKDWSVDDTDYKRILEIFKKSTKNLRVKNVGNDRGIRCR